MDGGGGGTKCKSVADPIKPSPAKPNAKTPEVIHRRKQASIAKTPENRHQWSWGRG